MSIGVPVLHAVAQEANDASSCFFPLWFSVTYLVDPLLPGTAATMLVALPLPRAPIPQILAAALGSWAAALRKMFLSPSRQYCCFSPARTLYLFSLGLKGLAQLSDSRKRLFPL